MSRPVQWVLIATLSLSFSVTHARVNQAAERVLWDKRPIEVHVPVGQERLVHFPTDVRYWLPDRLRGKASILAANGVLYVRAIAAFPSTRVRVQGLSDQRLYLLDLSANDQGTVSHDLIVMDEAHVGNRAKAAPPTATRIDWRIRLTRYAAQQLYAPERLLAGDPDIQRIPVDTRSVPLIRGGQLAAKPIAAWKGGGLFVTAIHVRNTQRHSLTLQFESSRDAHTLDLSTLLRGHWLTASVQHSTVARKGQSADSTTLYVVSDRPFTESLAPSVPGPAAKTRRSRG